MERRALAKIFTVTRDEYDLIEDFVCHHGRLFGYENIYILDNNSVDCRVLDAYYRFRRLGVNILPVEDYRKDGQGYFFTKYMLEQKDNAEFLIGMDTDEFIFSTRALREGRNPISQEEIFDVLRSLPLEQTVLEIDSYFYSKVDPQSPRYIRGRVQRPAADITSFYIDPTFWQKKLFYRGASFLSTENGNHKGKTTAGESGKAQIGYLHFSNTGSSRSFERAAKVMNGYDYFDISLSLEELVTLSTNFYRDDGIHRIREFRKGILRDYLFDLFVRIIRRFPSPAELDFHTNSSWKKTAEEIRTQFEQCQEAGQAREREPLSPAEVAEKRISLVFPDPPLSGKEFFYDFLAESLPQRF